MVRGDERRVRDGVNLFINRGQKETSTRKDLSTDEKEKIKKKKIKISTLERRQ